MFKLYLRASLFLTAMALLALMAAMRNDHASDTLVAGAFFTLLFLHSGIVSVVYASKRRDGEGQWALGAHAACLVMPLAQLGVNAAIERYQEARYEASPHHQLVLAIDHGDVADFEREFDRASGTRDHDPRALEEDWGAQAAEQCRLDILQWLQAHDRLGLGPDDERRYADWVRSAVACTGPGSDATRQPTVEWLIEQGRSAGWSLKSASHHMFNLDPFLERDLTDPAMVKLYETVIAAGADLDAEDDDARLLRRAVEDDRTAHVKFLSTHGYARAKFVEAAGRGSLLGPAIDRRSVPMLELLLSLGAQPDHSLSDDDWMRVCRRPDASETAQARAVVEVLLRHKLHLTRARFTEISASREFNEGEAECLRGFVR